MGFVQGTWTPTKRRGPIAAEFTGPGPACVGLPSLMGQSTQDATKSKSPSYTLSGRPNTKLETVGPGPAAFDLTKMTHKGKTIANGTQLSGRPKEVNNFVTPSPAHYTPEKCDTSLHDNAPKYTFGSKVKDAKPDNVPAPNKYQIPGLTGGSVRVGSQKQPPSISISGRTKTPPPPLYPGPGAYKTIDPNQMKDKSPAYTLSPRYDLPHDKTKVPGPGAFSPEKVNLHTRNPAHTLSPRYDLPHDKTKVPGPGAFSPEKVRLDSAPSLSFGIRHSQYSYSFPDKKK